MTNYRRCRVSGGTFFFTVVTFGRRPLLGSAQNVDVLRRAFRHVQAEHPFTVDAMVVLPDHLHAVWTLPPGEVDYSLRWRLIKYRFSLGLPCEYTASKSLLRPREKGLWQRRFWEHAIRDEADLQRHIDYVHFNPVKHGLVRRPVDWRFRRYLADGCYGASWGAAEVPWTLRGLERE
jgi:putative transposase